MAPSGPLHQVVFPTHQLYSTLSSLMIAYRLGLASQHDDHSRQALVHQAFPIGAYTSLRQVAMPTFLQLSDQEQGRLGKHDRSQPPIMLDNTVITC